MRLSPTAAAAFLTVGLAEAQVAKLTSSSTLDDPASILIDEASLPGDGLIVVRAASG